MGCDLSQNIAISLLFPTGHSPQVALCCLSSPALVEDPGARANAKGLRGVTSGSAHAGRCSCPQRGHSQGFHRGRGSGPCPPGAGIFAWAGRGWGHTGEPHRDDLVGRRVREKTGSLHVLDGVKGHFLYITCSLLTNLTFSVPCCLRPLSNFPRMARGALPATSVFLTFAPSHHKLWVSISSRSGVSFSSLCTFACVVPAAKTCYPAFYLDKLLLILQDSAHETFSSLVWVSGSFVVLASCAFRS